MDNDNIQSGQDYARLLINTIFEGELELSEDARMDSRLLQYWSEEIMTYADITWQDYITGKRETYLFDDMEFRQLFEKAGLKYASDILNGLVDKDMIQVGVREDGELVYSLTEKGKKQIDEEI
jgi:hypothetical protein